MKAICLIHPILEASARARARGEDAEIAFIVKTWLDSFQYADAAGPLPMDLYFQAYRETIKRLFGCPGVELALATPEADPKTFYGFIAWMGSGKHEHKHEKCGAPLLLYVYVKEAYRRQGLATELLLHAGIEATRAFCFPFKAAMWGEWGRRKWTGGHFRPLTLRFPLSKETTS